MTINGLAESKPVKSSKGVQRKPVAIKIYEESMANAHNVVRRVSIKTGLGLYNS